jgi:hypothetical protein
MPSVPPDDLPSVQEEPSQELIVARNPTTEHSEASIFNPRNRRFTLKHRTPEEIDSLFVKPPVPSGEQFLKDTANRRTKQIQTDPFTDTVQAPQNVVQPQTQTDAKTPIVPPPVPSNPSQYVLPPTQYVFSSPPFDLPASRSKPSESKGIKIKINNQNYNLGKNSSLKIKKKKIKNSRITKIHRGNKSKSKMINL